MFLKPQRLRYLRNIHVEKNFENMFGNKRYRAAGTATAETITIEVTPPEDGEELANTSDKVGKSLQRH